MCVYMVYKLRYQFIIIPLMWISDDAYSSIYLMLAEFPDSTEL